MNNISQLYISIINCAKKYLEIIMLVNVGAYTFKK